MHANLKASPPVHLMVLQALVDSGINHYFSTQERIEPRDTQRMLFWTARLQQRLQAAGSGHAGRPAPTQPLAGDFSPTERSARLSVSSTSFRMTLNPYLAVMTMNRQYRISHARCTRTRSAPLEYPTHMSDTVLIKLLAGIACYIAFLFVLL